MKKNFGMLLLIMLFSFITLSASFSREEYRGFWVDAFNAGFKTEAECQKLVNDMRNLNCNVIYLEVRKYCDAYYNSKYEPRAPELQAGFDPLKRVIELAHDTSGGKEYIEVHAWVVTYRSLIKGTKIPGGEPKHITITHPEWNSEDINGEKENEGRQYLDQGIPGVIDHNVNVVMDIVKNYDVDGIHFDYVRYSEKVDSKGNNIWGYNPITVARFNKLYQKEGKPKADDPDWFTFRQRQIDDLLRKVYANVKSVKPKVKVSAATVNWGPIGSDFKHSDPYRSTLQNWEGWMSKGLLDQNCIMNYKKKQNDKDYLDWTKLTANSKNGREAIIGLGAYFNPIYYTFQQLEAARGINGVDGIIFFSYAETNNQDKSQADFFKALKEGPFKDKVTRPKSDWIENPQTGIIMGTIKVNGEPADGAAVVTDKGQQLRTDGTGFYAFLNLPPDKYQVQLIFSDKQFNLGEIEIKKGSVEKMDYNVK